ncbi:MAG: FG-GAP-like repeat-containing protein [Chloroflexota bacterium]
MKIRLLLALALLATCVVFAGSTSRAAPLAAVQEPELKWQHGGCYSSWCETGWYASPAVADLDGDGAMEVIGAAYTVFILNGEDGTLEQSVDTPGSRVWPGVVVADVDGSGDLEIVTAQGGGYLNLLDHTGEVVWTRQPTTNELRGLSAYDLDADGSLELIVTGAVYGKTNTWVYEHDGTLRAGWPQLIGDSGYAYGVFNDNAAVGDLDGDGAGEIVVPADVHYICAYEAGGAQIPAHAMYGGKGWGAVGVWESPEIELRGWGDCSSTRDERYRTNFAHGPAAIADVNGDGAVEVITTGNVYDCSVGHPPGKYNGVYIFNADRSRFNAGGYNWENPPVDTGAPLSEDYGDIENNQPNPAVADLDGDGELEILYASYDGRVHAFWLDKTEHGDWPYSVYDAGEGFYRFASEPTVADLDGDGHAEVIFASWTEKSSGQTGKLHILDYHGHPLREVALPAAYGSPDWNGALAAPTLADIDGDPDLEVVLNTAHSGFVAYDLPGTAGARVLWGTGRGNTRRTGAILPGPLQSWRASVQPALPGPGSSLTYTLRLENPGPALYHVHLTRTLPADVDYAGDLWASSGSYGEAGGVITWTGSLPALIPVTVTFGATVGAHVTTPQALVDITQWNDGLGNEWQQQVMVIANGYATYLPLTLK